MILVTGANGVIGKPLVDYLTHEDEGFISVSCGAHHNQIRWNLEQPPTESVRQRILACDSLIYCAPIWLLAPQMHEIAQVSWSVCTQQ